MVGILNPAGNGAYWISALNGKVVVDGEASVFLAASFSSPSLSLLILSFMGKTTGRSSLLLEVTELRLASRWMRISSSLFRPSRSKTLRDGLRASFVGFLSCDFIGALGLVRQPEAVLL